MKKCAVAFDCKIMVSVLASLTLSVWGVGAIVSLGSAAPLDLDHDGTAELTFAWSPQLVCTTDVPVSSCGTSQYAIPSGSVKLWTTGTSRQITTLGVGDSVPLPSSSAASGAYVGGPAIVATFIDSPRFGTTTIRSTLGAPGSEVFLPFVFSSEGMDRHGYVHLRLGQETDGSSQSVMVVGWQLANAADEPLVISPIPEPSSAAATAIFAAALSVRRRRISAPTA